MFRQTKEIKENSKSKNRLVRFLSRIKEDSVLFFGGKSVDKNKSTSQFVPITLEQSALERRRRSIRNFVGKTFTLASVSIILGTVALQAGGSIIGVSADYTTAYAENKQGQKSSALERSIDQLKIAAGEVDGSLSSGAKGLSPAEVKTVGFFISNWYSPFTTRVSGSTGNAVGDYHTDIKDLLVKHAGLAEDPAGDLAKLVVNVGKQTSETLYLAKSDDGGQTWTSLGSKATYFEVLLGSVGILPDSVLSASGKGNEITLKDRYQYDADKKTILGLVRESKVKDKDLKRQEIVYEWNPSPSGEPTVAQATFYTNFASVDSNKAWGSTILTLDGSDTTINDLMKEQPADLTEKLNRYFEGVPLNASDKGVDPNVGSLKGFYDRSIYSASLYVDGFGNLISDTGTTSLANFVIMPASQNPMMYARKGAGSSSSTSSTEDKSKDKGKEKDKEKETSNKSTTGVDAKMSEIYNAKDTGIGRSIVSNNLNSVALNKGKGFLKIDGDKATLWINI